MGSQRVGTARWRAAWIWARWRRHKAWLLVMAFFTILSSVATLAYPLVLKHVIDAVTTALTGGGTGVGRETLVVLGGLLAIRLGAGMYPAVRAWMNMRFELDIRSSSFDRLLNKDFRFFLKFPTGDLITRLTDDLREYPKLAWFLSSGLFRAADALCRFTFCLGAVVLLDWRVAAISLVPLPGGIYLYYVLRHRLHRAFGEQQRAISRTNEALEATFSGIRIVKAFTAELGQEDKLATILRERAGVQYRVARLFALTWYGDAGIGKLCQGIALLTAGMFVVRGELTVGGLYAIYLYLERLMQPLTELPGLPAVAKQAFVSMDRVAEIDAFPSPEVPLDGPEPAAPATVELRGVGFSYREGRELLRDIELLVHPGEWVGLVGAVGSGKTTLLKILAGILPPTSGHVLVNGTDLRVIPPDSYRRLIGYVPQESSLFSDSILNNILVGRDIDDSDVWSAIEAAQLATELARMEDGLQTRLGHRGSMVSGGQRQRLAIARALAGKPALLLLDDCTASLDAETEGRFWEWVAGLPGRPTVILASHRLATIEMADRVILLGNGTIAAQGSHGQLLSISEEYRSVLLGPTADEVPAVPIDIGSRGA